jgi:hypothetical protein
MTEGRSQATAPFCMKPGASCIRRLEWIERNDLLQATARNGK